MLSYYRITGPLTDTFKNTWEQGISSVEASEIAGHSSLIAKIACSTIRLRAPYKLNCELNRFHLTLLDRLLRKMIHMESAQLVQNEVRYNCGAVTLLDRTLIVIATM